MSIEHSHGKARPTMPRPSDLRLVGAEAQRPAWRGADGRVGTGNELGKERGQKMDLARMLGRDATGEDALAVTREATRTYRAALRELPSQGELVRRAAARMARHCAAETFFAAKSIEAGLETEDGMRFDTLATRHGERGERCLVVLLDVAGALARPSKRNARRPSAPKNNNVHAALEKEFGGKS
jgi:hypothetical protein